MSKQSAEEARTEATASGELDDGALEGVAGGLAGLKLMDDDGNLVQFDIQLAMSDLQNAENVRSQAEKRLETQRKDLTRNWGG